MAADPALIRRAALGIGFLLGLMAAVLFLSAGTLAWRQGWLMLATFGLASLVITGDLIRRDPALLERRTRGGPAAETDPRQRVIQTLTGGLFLLLLIMPGLERRWGGADAPWPAVLAADGVILAAYAGIWRVFAVNSFAAGVIEVSSGQKVIDSGPYAVVRHPMYAFALPMIAAIPLALGSVLSMLWALPMTAAIVWRLLDEERQLRAELPGYVDYCARVRWRLLPGVF